MTTQSMYDKGLRCRGRGFNCLGCKNKNECIEYINTEFKPQEKPPIGIMPKYIWDLQRINNLREAIDRYCEANIEVPIEWIEEYNSLVRLYKDKEQL